MFSFLLNRLAILVPIFFGVSLVSFSFIRILPGDPVETIAGERGVTPERHAEIMAQLGLDKPIWEQYLVYIGDILTGDFGRSFITNKPVFAEFIELEATRHQTLVTGAHAREAFTAFMEKRKPVFD